MSGNTSNHYVDAVNTLTNGKEKWIPGKATDGSVHVKNQIDNTYPQLSPQDDSIALVASGDGSDAVIARTVANGSIMFQITDADIATAETITIKAYLDEALTIETAALIPIDIATGVAAAGGSALPDGDYEIRGITCHGWHFEKSASTRTPTISYVDAS